MNGIEQLTGPISLHGEGPVWYDGWGGLRWVDMLMGDVLSLRENGSVVRTHFGSIIAAIRPRTDGGMVAAGARSFLLTDPADERVTDLGELWQDPQIRMNEGACDPCGNFYCGTMAANKAEGAGTLYRLDAGHSVTTALTGVTISNGLEWSPDGSAAYYVDTPTQRIDVFDFDSELGLHNRRPFVLIPREDGAPDGLAVDAEGGVWVAIWNGSAVHRYTANGVLDGRVDLPTCHVTACTFGGASLDELFITTSRMEMRTEESPFAGALFSTKPGVKGLPVQAFAG